MNDPDNQKSEVPPPPTTGPTLDVTVVLIVPLVFLGELLVQAGGTLSRLIGATLLTLYSAIILILDPQGVRRMVIAVPRFLRSAWRWARHRKYAALLAVGTVVLVVTPLVFATVFSGPIGLPFCPIATQVRVLTTPDQLDTTEELVTRYVQLTTAANKHCPLVTMYVYAVDPGTTGADVEAALAKGWNDDGRTVPSRDLGPRPDMWLAGSDADVSRVQQLARRGNQPPPVRDADYSLASSPVVLGIFGSQVPERFRNHQPATWSDILADGTLGGIVRADPRNSTDAATATLAMYLSEGWQPGDTSRNLSLLRQVEQRIRGSLGSLGSSQVDGTAALLCRVAAANDPRPVIASEQALLRFGMLGAAGCARPATKPLLVYPSDTLLLDHPFVRFTWTSARADQAVRAFRDWLGGPDGRAELLRLGLRPGGTIDPGAMPSDRQGPPPERPPHRSAPPVDHACGQTEQVTSSVGGDVLLTDLTCALDTYLKLQVPGRVLLAVDSSGSMGEPVGPAGQTRATVVAGAVRHGLNQMGPQDEFGLWEFPQNSTGQGHRELVPVRKGTVGQRDRVTAALARLRPQGNTPLYTTIVDAVRLPSLREKSDLHAALVVLTDGEDTSGGLTADDVRAAVRSAGVRVFVIAVGEASCEGSPIEGIGGGHCYHTDFNHIDGTLHQLFSVLWGGR